MFKLHNILQFCKITQISNRLLSCIVHITFIHKICPNLMMQNKKNKIKDNNEEKHYFFHCWVQLHLCKKHQCETHMLL
jgi:hypothetical protein